MKAGNGTSGLKITLGVYLIVFALKLGVYFLTGSLALMAEAFHSLADIFIAGFLLAAAAIARKEADEGHRYGHGRAENVAALVASVLFISFTSYKLYEEAVPRLFRPAASAPQNLGLAVGVLLVSMVIAAFPLLKMLRRGSEGAAEKALIMELINDELGLLAALAGTLCVMGGYPLADPLAAIVVATVIAVSAVGLFRENASFLLGRSPGPEVLAEVESLARTVPGVLGVHDLRASFIGPDSLQAELHLSVARGLPIEEADRIADETRELIRRRTQCRYCTIHVDAAP